jgi:hypothetical protein
VNKGKLYHTTSVHRRPADSNGLNYAYVWKNVVTACSPFRLDKSVCRRFATVGSIEANPDIAMQLDESKDWGFDGNCECACGCGTFTKWAPRRASCSVWKPSKKQMQYRLKAASVLTDTADCF